MKLAYILAGKQAKPTSIIVCRVGRSEYGVFLLFDLPFMNQEQGVVYSLMSLEQEDK